LKRRKIQHYYQHPKSKAGQFIHVVWPRSTDGSEEKDVHMGFERTREAFGIMNRIWRNRELTKKTEADYTTK